MLRPRLALLAPALVLAAGLAAGCSTDPGACGDGQVEVDGQCIDGTCVPGTTECDGPRVATCLDDASGFGASAACPGGQLCYDGACTEASACEAQDPPCCATQADCGSEVQPNSCEECRPIARDAWCDAASCVTVPADDLVRFTVRLEAKDLTPTEATSVSSAVVTFYAPETSDGRPMSCESVLAEGTDGTSPHDAKDPTLNTFISAMANVQFPMGTDVYSLEVPSVSPIAGQVIVATVYRFSNGAGPRLARGCVDSITPVDGDGVKIALQPEG